jgi:pimeloyl-ACP methyl ester carboxylesterase
VEVHEAEIDGQPVVWRSAPGADVLYVHGVPTNGRLWEPFLARSGGIAVDLPGFGGSTKRGDFDFTITGYGRWLDQFAELVDLQRFRLCVQDWGALALAWAARRAERVERLVVMDAVPLLPGYRWHRVARAWRTPMLGEVVMGLTTKWGLRRSVPAPIVDLIWDAWDQGTQRAILRLYRASDPAVLAGAGLDLGLLRCPALILWGGRDPYLPAHFAEAYAQALGGDAEVVHLPEAGHWPWLDEPSVVERVGDFLSR